MYTQQATSFYSPAMASMPPLVGVFTQLRQSECQINAMRYPELSARVDTQSFPLGGDAASKLTAALSIHIEGFLGLSCTESGLGDSQITFVARFSSLMSREDVEKVVQLRAADIIDTLIALG